MDTSHEAVALFDKYAVDYQNKFMDTSLYHDSFDVFCSNIKKQNAEILELACGPGNITNYILKKRPDFKILGTDLSNNMLELAKVNNPSAEFQLMDSRNIDKLYKKYDAIMCGFCLPYLSKQEAIKLIADCKNILYTNGVIYISTMEGDNTTSAYQTGSKGDKVFINYHEEDYLIQTLINCGFTLVYKNQIKNKMGNNIDVTDLILIGISS